MSELSSLMGFDKNHSPMLKISGTLISGRGEGAYFVSLEGYAKQFIAKIGYLPFPGTFNVKLEQDCVDVFQKLQHRKGVLINKFSDGKRTFGWVKCFKAKLNNSVDCELIILEKTYHNSSIVELISKDNIRKKAKMVNGSKIEIKIPIAE